MLRQWSTEFVRLRITDSSGINLMFSGFTFLMPRDVEPHRRECDGIGPR